MAGGQLVARRVRHGRMGVPAASMGFLTRRRSLDAARLVGRGLRNPESDRLSRSHQPAGGGHETIGTGRMPYFLEHAPHTWSGFSTGEWDGDTLVVTTTHVKESYIRRAGLMRSDRSTIRTRWRRIGDLLQATVIIYDPVYLAEPYIRSTMMWQLDSAMRLEPYPCERGVRDCGASRHGRTFPSRHQSAAGPGSKACRRVRHAASAAARRTPTMYPEDIKKMKGMPTPETRAPRGSTERGSSQPLLEPPR